MSEIKNLIFEPFITHIPADNFIFSLLEKDSSAFHAFIMKYYIKFHAVFLPEEQNYIYRFKDTCQWNKFEEFSHIFISKESIGKIKTEDITELLKAGYFVMTCINMKYISQYQSGEDCSHEIMIYGADLEERKFLCKDYFNNVEYKLSAISFEEIVNALRNYDKTGYIRNDTGFAAIKLMKRKWEKKIDLPEYVDALQCNVGDKHNIFDAVKGFINSRGGTFTLHDLFTVRVFFNFVNENIKLFHKRMEIISSEIQIAPQERQEIIILTEKFSREMMIHRNMILRSEVNMMSGRKVNEKMGASALLNGAETAKDSYSELIHIIRGICKS